MIVQELVAKLGLEVDGQGFAVAEQLMAAARAGMVAIGAAAGAAAVGLAAAVAKTAAYSDAIDNAAQRTGIGVEALQALRYAAERADVGAEGLQSALNFMAKRGVRDFEAELMRAADELSGMPDGAAKAARAMELFGKQGVGMIPMLNKGSAGLAEMTAFAREAGIVLGEDVVADGAALKAALDELQAYIRGLAFTIAGPFLKPVREWIKSAGEWFRVNRLVISQRFEATVQAIGSALSQAARLVEPFIDMLGRVSSAIAESETAMAVLRTLAVGLGVAFAAPLIPIALLLMAIEELWGWITGKRKTLLEDELGSFEDFKKSMELINPEDSGFVVAAKWTAQALKEAYHWALGIKDLLSGHWTKGGRDALLDGLAVTPGPVGWYFRMGRYMEKEKEESDRERAARAAVTAPAVAPLSAPPTSPGRSGPALQITGGITVNAAPGTDGAKLAYDITAELERIWDGKMAQALPVVGGP